MKMAKWKIGKIEIKCPFCHADWSPDSYNYQLSDMFYPNNGVATCEECNKTFGLPTVDFDRKRTSEKMNIVT